MGATKSGARKVPSTVDLSDEFLYTNYRDTVERMLNFGICSKRSADAMFDRIEELIPAERT